MGDGLGIRSARGGAIAARPGKGRELVEGIEVARIPAQRFDVGLLGGIVLPRTGERAGTFERGGDAQRFISHCSSRISATLERYITIAVCRARRVRINEMQ